MLNLLRNRKTWYIAAPVLIVVVVAALWLTLVHAHGSGSDKKTNTAPKATSIAVVEITSNGFLPSTLSVNQDTEVVWVNEDVMPHLPAADPYPTHSSLPYLVAPRALGQKETYSFLFTKKGTVHYHDDINPILTGTIEVR